MKRFDFDISITATLSVDDIWPDGDAPENPTVSDVRQVFIESGRGNIMRAAREWNLDDDADLTISYSEDES
jgi:hypothetical protein